jgi:hypothetical protein
VEQKLENLNGHAYAPGAEPGWWQRFNEVLGQYGLTPETVSLMLLGAAVAVVAIRRVSGRGKGGEFDSLDRAVAKQAESQARREVLVETARELRIRRALGGDVET